MKQETWHRLLAGPSRDLRWNFSNSAEDLLWHLDFEEEKIDPFNSPLFHAHALAVEEFGKQAPKGSKVILASMQLERENKGFERKILLSPGLEEAYLGADIEDKELFYAQILSEYLHRLASFLPDEIEPFLSVKVDPQVDIAQACFYLCRRRFEHLGLYFPFYSLPVLGEKEKKIGIAIPLDELFDPLRFKKLFLMAEEKKEPFICIPEEYLNEHWDGVDLLLVDRKTLSPLGQRMIKGFIAAGGEVCFVE